ncbi:MAG TPA: nucleotide sugar dehydrogenase [Acidimicrobiia bacterium]|nr:nucleotide sugar dehydrogenase [Acidimicrobiia bacterium]
MAPRAETRRAVIMGQGYVGLPLAMRASEVGYDVVGFDTDEERIKRLASGEPQVEDVSEARLDRALRGGHYLPTTSPDDCAQFDVAVIAVPTPLRDGAPDLSHIEGAASILGPHVRTGSTVVLESTTYPGTTEELLVPELESRSRLEGGRDFRVGYSPERLDPGNRTWDLVNTPKVVSGIDDASTEAVRSFYEEIVDHTVVVSGPKVAELTKLLENTFRHVNIALVNELAMFAHDLDIDVWEAIEAASTKPHGFMPFVPGPGVGGHCLPVDPSYLSWQVRRELGQSFRFVELANDVNAGMPDYVVRRLIVALNSRGRAVNGSRLLLLGLSYKENTGDGRESPGLRVAELLLELGAEVRAADPHVEDRWIDPRVVRVDFSPLEVEAVDAVVVLTAHDAFDYASVASQAPLVLDMRHCVPAGQTVEHL